MSLLDEIIKATLAALESEPSAPPSLVPRLRALVEEDSFFDEAALTRVLSASVQDPVTHADSTDH